MAKDLATAGGESPSPSAYSLSSFPNLVKSGSTASAGTHVSIPVTGAIPLGGLRLVRPSSPDSGSVLRENDPPPPPPPPRCLDNGDAFLILGLPSGFTVGCDSMALTTEPASRFLGLRDLPAGPHFVWVSEPQALSRSGYWFVTRRPGDVRVKQWDSYNEVLGEAASQVEVRAQKTSIDALYPGLVPYRCRRPYPSARRTLLTAPLPLLPPPPPPKDPPKGTSVAAQEATLGATALVHDDAGDDDDTDLWHRLTSSIAEDLLRRTTGSPNKRGAATSTSEWLVNTSDTCRGEVDFSQASRLFRAVAGSELTFLFPRDAMELHLLSISDAARRRPTSSMAGV